MCALLSSYPKTSNSYGMVDNQGLPDLKFYKADTIRVKEFLIIKGITEIIDHGIQD